MINEHKTQHTTVSSMRGYTYDDQGNVTSCRYTDGIGWDYTYDDQGNELSYRHTDGAGYDIITHDIEYKLCRNIDGTYSAGCRENLTLEQALVHWGLPRVDERAVLFTEVLSKETI